MLINLLKLAMSSVSMYVKPIIIVTSILAVTAIGTYVYNYIYDRGYSAHQVVCAKILQDKEDEHREAVKIVEEKILDITSDSEKNSMDKLKATSTIIYRIKEKLVPATNCVLPEGLVVDINKLIVEANK